MHRTVISSTDVDPETGGGIPGTGGVVIIETMPCRLTCTGSRARVTDEALVTRFIPCSACGAT